MSNWYAKAIEVITNDGADFKKIVIEISKLAPKIVVDSYQKISGANDWRPECKALMLAGQKLPAIKLCRSLTGMSLIDAKNSCEALI